MVLKLAARGAAVLAAAVLSLACVADASSSGYSTGGGYSGGGTSDVPSATSPMLVEVDTGKTMSAQPGDGVGVFVEYAAGGKWHVWWTCDTNQTRQACDFNVAIASQSGALTYVKSEAFSTGDVLSIDAPQQISAATRTTTEVHGLTFETAAGASIRLDASVSGLKDSGFIFFVQDGVVNGGFAGVLTNPLLLRGTTP